MRKKLKTLLCFAFAAALCGAEAHAQLAEGMKSLASADLGAGSGAKSGASDLSSGPFPPDIQRVKDRGVLRVAQYCGERPLFFMWLPKDVKVPEDFTLDIGDKRIGGVDIGLAKFFADRLGVKLELKRDYKTFSEVVKAVAKGEADVGLSKLCPTFERMQLVRFSKPYATFNIALLVNRGTLLKNETYFNAKSSYDDYMAAFNRPGIRIGVQDNAAAKELAQIMFPKARIIPFRLHENAVLAARDGNVEAALSDDFEFLFMSLFDPEINVYCSLLRPPESPYHICMAVNPDSPNLLSVADEVSNYVKIYDAQTMIRKFGRALKNIEAHMRDSKDHSEESAYPFDSGELGKKQRLAGFGGSDALIAVVVGGLMLLLVSAWLRMSRGRGEAKHV